MIEISHNQARRLIQQGLHRRLPEEQWSALQVHLEVCSACRDYNTRLSVIEKGMSHVLRRRWSSVNGPLQNIGQAVVQNQVKRSQRRQQIKRVSMGLGLVALMSLFVIYSKLTASEQTNAGLAEITPSPVNITPTQQNLLFNGVVAFASFEQGNHDVRLINAGKVQKGLETTNLSVTSAFNETHPVWSPDGEWLAFLSDRSPTGSENKGYHKTEVYVMNVAGSRLARLTDSPDINWQGPLSWSADGKQIALVGYRAPTLPDQTPQPWIYLVPLDGSGAFSAAFSRGAEGLVQFSQMDQFLAYTSSLYIGQLAVYQPETGNTIQVLNNKISGQPGTMVRGFSWFPNGFGLVYLQEHDGRSELRRTGSIDTSFSNLQIGPSDQLLEAGNGPGIFKSVSMIPGRQMVAFLQNRDGDGCWMLRLNRPDRVNLPVDMDGLCIDSSLGLQNFTPDGDWLIVRAHEPGTQPAGTRVSFYALRVPADLAAAGPLYYEKLADVDIPAGQGSEPIYPEPVVRPAGKRLAITAHEVGRAAPRTELSIPPENTPGQLVYSRLLSQIDHSVVVMSNRPDGTRRAALTTERYRSYCPAISPSGDRVAFVAEGEGAKPGGTELYWMNPDGTNIHRLTGAHQADLLDQRVAYLTPQYDCPVWSPDGLILTAVVRFNSDSGQSLAYLALITLDGEGIIPEPDGMSRSYRFIPIHANGMPSYLTGPHWTPDGKRILLVFPSYGADSSAHTRLVAIDPAKVSDAGDGAEIILSLNGWTDVNGLAFSADGQRLAFISFNSNNRGGTQAQLRVLRADDWTILSAPRLDDFAYGGGGGALTWLPDGRIALAYRTGLAGPLRTNIAVYDPSNLRLDVKGLTQDVLYNAAWSHDGRWMAYTADSGLWMLDFEAAVSGEAFSPPALWDDGIVYDLDWR